MFKKILLSLVLFFSITAFAAENPVVVLETTQGSIELELYPDVAPLAVENFTTHVKNGYYNGIAFHRIIQNFMIQGGDPTESGRGGESIWKKDFKDEFKGKTFDKVGVLAMANAGPGTNGSQFFITTNKTPWLNGYHTIFGQATAASMQTIQKLNNVPTLGRGGADRPQERQEIIKAYIKGKK
ncbi:MAG: peptidylprolyl isomerase [Sulfurimonas sp.]|nr:peptidylprolyl isomerase [Sulfurimonas sp.]MDD3060671.1 peptidylprolyl isomerase [Sulfurimonas sp.]MDD5202661.1 peptidylprolyl isomerase [Sulfurimonas sp.]